MVLIKHFGLVHKIKYIILFANSKLNIFKNKYNTNINSNTDSDSDTDTDINTYTKQSLVTTATLSL